MLELVLLVVPLAAGTVVIIIGTAGLRPLSCACTAAVAAAHSMRCPFSCSAARIYAGEHEHDCLLMDQESPSFSSESSHIGSISSGDSHHLLAPQPISTSCRLSPVCCLAACTGTNARVVWSWKSLQWFLNDGLDWTHLYAHLHVACSFPISSAYICNIWLMYIWIVKDLSWTQNWYIHSASKNIPQVIFLIT